MEQLLLSALHPRPYAIQDEHRGWGSDQPRPGFLNQIPQFRRGDRRFNVGYLSRIGEPLAFRRWLERANPLLEAQTPAARLAEGAWAEIADQVDEMLTGFRQ
jgi:hypothetical protein